MLGVAAWEQALSGLLSRPIFRLPDFLAKSAEVESILDAAILWDHRGGPTDDGPLDAALDAWLSASGRSTVQIHVFATDPGVRNRLRKRRKTAGRIITHDTDAAFRNSRPDTPTPAFG